MENINLYESTKAETVKIGKELEADVKCQYTFRFQAAFKKEWDRTLKELRDILSLIDGGDQHIKELEVFISKVNSSQSSGLDLEMVLNYLIEFANVLNKNKSVEGALEMKRILMFWFGKIDDAAEGKF